MWTYEKKLQYPVRIRRPNPAAAKLIITQLGGPDGELAAAMRYLNQRFAMPYDRVKALLTDIGTEELAHLEIIGAIVYQLTRNLTIDQIKASGFDTYFADHTIGIYPQAAAGFPFTAAVFQSKGDPITDLMEDMAAEQKARTTYENLIRLVDDPDVLEPLRFLRQREIVHFQRFGEALGDVRRYLDSRNFYAVNPAFDTAPVNIEEIDSSTGVIPCVDNGDLADANYAADCDCSSEAPLFNDAVNNFDNDADYSPPCNTNDTAGDFDNDADYDPSCNICGTADEDATSDNSNDCTQVLFTDSGSDSSSDSCGCQNSDPVERGCRTNAGEDIPIYGDDSCCPKNRHPKHRR